MTQQVIHPEADQQVTPQHRPTTDQPRRSQERDLRSTLPRRRVRGAALAAVLGVVLAVVVGLLVWVAAARSDQAVVEYSREQLAEIARLQGQADMYERQPALQRGHRADAARWAGQAEFYDQVRQARASAAATARLQGLADHFAGR